MENTTNQGPFEGSRYLASGLLVEIDPATGLATPVTCDWWVTQSGIECGAKVRRHRAYPHRSDTTVCDAGHDRLPIEIEHAPYGPAWRREMAERDDWPCLVHGPADDECLGNRCLTGRRH